MYKFNRRHLIERLNLTQPEELPTRALQDHHRANFQDELQHIARINNCRAYMKQLLRNRVQINKQRLELVGEAIIDI